MERTIQIPQEVRFRLEGDLIVTQGPKGEIERRLAYPGVDIQLKDSAIILKTKKNTRNQKRILGTFSSHIKNMIKGALQGYEYKLKICSGHFPMKVTTEKDNVVISNFLGEKIPRKAKILLGASVKIDRDIIFVSGSDKEKVGQTAANIERATIIRNRDRRVFQDGCFLMKDG